VAACAAGRYAGKSAQIPTDLPDSGIAGSSKAMQEIRAQLLRLAHLPWPVRLEGPSGTGKNLAARALHCWSSRRDGPFVACNVNVLAVGLEIDELVGHVRGAFTGAVSDCIGAFEAAHGGTLFIDEIATASPNVQRALLQLLEDRSIRRLGEHRIRQVDARVVFATNADLEKAVEAGRFRPDLYHRLGSLVVRMPPLAEHIEDVPELVELILERKAAELEEPLEHPPTSVFASLMEYSWPGNVRELEHALEHYAAFGLLPPSVHNAVALPSWRQRLDDVLERHCGNKSAAARELRVSRNTVYKELKRRSASS
jgi:DNA-binding NtrC family response regulator